MFILKCNTCAHTHTHIYVNIWFLISGHFSRLVLKVTTNFLNRPRCCKCKLCSFQINISSINVLSLIWLVQNLENLCPYIWLCKFMQHITLTNFTPNKRGSLHLMNKCMDSLTNLVRMAPGWRAFAVTFDPFS